jgi:hypothetical protein
MLCFEPMQNVSRKDIKKLNNIKNTKVVDNQLTYVINKFSYRNLLCIQRLPLHLINHNYAHTRELKRVSRKSFILP